MRIFVLVAAMIAANMMFIFSAGWHANAREAASEVFTTATCADSTTAALAANPGRRAALIVNDSTQTIWIKIGEAAVANEGIRLNANGGSYYIAADAANYDTEAVNCIVASGTGLLVVSEWSDG